MQPIQTIPSGTPGIQPPTSEAMQEMEPQPSQPEQQSQNSRSYEEQLQQRTDHRHRYQAAGVPVWGVLLILVGLVALFGNLGIGLGWLFGLALGAWFVYQGARHIQDGGTVNWWLVGLGLLIGLGAISSGFLDKLVFPIVLVVVGLGIMSEYAVNRVPREQ